MRFIVYFIALFVALMSTQVLAAESASAAAGMSMLKVILGLALVLALLVGFAWLMKKMGMNHLNANTVARVVGGVSVGSRERVVVVEVANRWLVVGVTATQVTQLANLDPIETTELAENQHSPQQAFGVWLQKAMKKTPSA